jgi:hypothetical protein
MTDEKGPEGPKTCEIVVNGFSIKDIIADSLRWRKGSTVDDDFIQKVSEEIRDVFKAKLLIRNADE